MGRGQVSAQKWRDSHRDLIKAKARVQYERHREAYKKNIATRIKLIRIKVAQIGPSTDPESLFYVGGN